MTTKNYEEHKGYIIAPGITMPAQGIYDYDVFESMRDFEDGKPATTERSRDQAIAWVDRVVATGVRAGATWWSEYDYTESPAPYVSPTARAAVARMPQDAQDLFRMVAALDQTDEPELRKSRTNEILAKMQAAGITPPFIPPDYEEGVTVGAIEKALLEQYMSSDEYSRFLADIS